MFLLHTLDEFSEQQARLVLEKLLDYCADYLPAFYSLCPRIVNTLDA